MVAIYPIVTGGPSGDTGRLLRAFDHELDAGRGHCRTVPGPVVLVIVSVVPPLVVHRGLAADLPEEDPLPACRRRYLAVELPGHRPHPPNGATGRFFGEPGLPGRPEFGRGSSWSRVAVIIRRLPSPVRLATTSAGGRTGTVLVGGKVGPLRWSDSRPAHGTGRNRLPTSLRARWRSSVAPQPSA